MIKYSKGGTKKSSTMNGEEKLRNATRKKRTEEIEENGDKENGDNVSSGSEKKGQREKLQRDKKDKFNAVTDGVQVNNAQKFSNRLLELNNLSITRRTKCITMSNIHLHIARRHNTSFYIITFRIDLTATSHTSYTPSSRHTFAGFRVVSLFH